LPANEQFWGHRVDPLFLKANPPSGPAKKIDHSDLILGICCMNPAAVGMDVAIVNGRAAQ
jgi:hypothetical protein